MPDYKPQQEWQKKNLKGYLFKLNKQQQEDVAHIESPAAKAKELLLEYADKNKNV